MNSSIRGRRSQPAAAALQQTLCTGLVVLQTFPKQRATLPCCVGWCRHWCRDGGLTLLLMSLVFLLVSLVAMAAEIRLREMRGSTWQKKGSRMSWREKGSITNSRRIYGLRLRPSASNIWIRQRKDYSSPTFCANRPSACRISRRGCRFGGASDNSKTGGMSIASGRRRLAAYAREDWVSDFWQGFGSDGGAAASAAKAAKISSSTPVETLQQVAALAITQLKTSKRVQAITIFALSLLFLRAATINRDRAYLRDIGICNGVLTPSFSPWRQEYVLEIPEGLMQLSLRPQPKYDDAQVSIGSTAEDQTAENVTIRMNRPASMTSTRTEKLIRIAVKSSNHNKERTYTIRVKRELPKPVTSMDVGVFGRPKEGNKMQDYLGEDAYFVVSKRRNNTQTSRGISKGEVDEKGLYFCSYLTEADAIGIADGVGGWKEMGVDPGEYSKSLMDITAKRIVDKFGEPHEALKLAQELTRAPGTSTATVLSIDPKGMILRAANIGDSGYVIFRNGREVGKSVAQLHQFNMPYQLGSLEIEPDANTVLDADLYTTALRERDVIVLATDGLFDNVHMQQIGKIVKYGIERDFDPMQIARSLVDEAYRVSLGSKVKTPWASAMTKEIVPTWKRALGTNIRGGKRDDITVIVGIVRSDFF